jgi:hypothetical protein
VVVTCRASEPGSLAERFLGGAEIARNCQRVPARHEQTGTGRTVGGEVDRPVEEVERCVHVLSVPRGPSGRGKPFCRPAAERRVGRSQLGLVAVRLLEVVADDLVGRLSA